MANISVTELVFDPDFVDPCQVLREVEVIGDDGVAIYQTTTIDIVASIQAASGDDLVVTDASAHTSGTYEVITAFPLAAATDANKADTVLFAGREYVVISIGRFGNFAGNAGHYEGLMTIKTISPQAGPP